MKKSILLLILLASILPELLTGSTPLSAFFNIPRLLFLFIGYGLAVLVIREIAIRNNLSYGGTYILGIAFGIFNEGFLAKTLIKITGLPIVQYDNYGYFLGVNFPFTIAISFWHALAAVLTPILIVYWFYPNEAATSWLNKKLTILLTTVLLLLGSLSLLGESIIKGSLTQLMILLGMMFILFFIAKKFKRSNEITQSVSNINLKPVWLGISIFFPYFLLLTYISGTKLPIIIFFGTFALIIFGYYQTLKRKNWLTSQGLLLFGLGVYIQNTIFGAMLGFTVPGTIIERVLVGIICTFALIWFSKKVVISEQQSMNSLTNQISISET